MTDVQSTRPLRRSSDEVRRLILDAARELFASHGYAATTTAQIAKRAGVGDRLIFTNFGSKADLFEATVLAPFSQWLTDYFQQWQHDPGGMSPDDRIRAFVTGFFSLVRKNREVLLSLTAARNHSADGLREPAELIRNQLATTLAELQVIPRDAVDHRGVTGLNPPISVTVSASAILGVALLDDWVAPAETDEDQLVEELTTMISYGLLRRP